MPTLYAVTWTVWANGCNVVVLPPVSGSSGLTYTTPAATPVPPPVRPKLVLKPKNVALHAWRISTRGDSDYKKTHRRWERQGFQGVCLGDESRYEMKKVNAFMRTLPAGERHASPWHHDHEYFNDVGQWPTISRCFYIRPQAMLDLFALIERLPPRTQLIPISDEIPPAMRSLLRGLNHYVFPIEHKDRKRWMLSVQETTHLDALRMFA